MCKPGTDTFETNLEIKSHGNAFTHVMVPSFPSTGSTWLKELINGLSGAHDLGTSLTCDIYHEGKDMSLMSYEQQNLCCKDEHSGDLGAVSIKTHFPAQEQFHHSPFEDSYQYSASMSFDKVLLLVRDPETTVASNNKRWGGSSIDSVYCWAAWWERVRVKMETENPGNFQFLRYEDLCSDTVNTMMEVFDFMGVRVSRDEVQARFAERPELKCRHVDDFEVHPQKEKAKQLLSLWQYKL